MFNVICFGKRKSSTWKLKEYSMNLTVEPTFNKKKSRMLAFSPRRNVTVFVEQHLFYFSTLLRQINIIISMSIQCSERREWWKEEVILPTYSPISQPVSKAIIFSSSLYCQRQQQQKSIHICCSRKNIYKSLLRRDNLRTEREKRKMRALFQINNIHKSARKRSILHDNTTRFRLSN